MAKKCTNDGRSTIVFDGSRDKITGFFHIIIGATHDNAEVCPLNHGNIIRAITDRDSAFKGNTQVGAQRFKPAGFRYS